MSVAGRISLASVALFCLALGWLGMARFPVGCFNDDAAFVLGARDLLGGSWPSHTYFPGQALLLAPLLWLGMDNLEVLRWLSLSMTLAGAACFGLLARRHVPGPAAVLIGASYILNPSGISYGSTLLSDVGFGLLCGLALWLGEEEPSPRRALLTGTLAGLACSFRVAGFVLLAAAVLAPLLHRRAKAAALVVAGALLPMLPALVHMAGGVSGQTYLQAASLGWGDLVGLQKAYWLGFPTRFGQGFLGPQPFLAVPALVLLGLAGAGCLGLVRRGRTLVPLFLAGYLAFHSFWAFPEPRYFMPVWPCLVLAATTLFGGRGVLLIPGLTTALSLTGTAFMIELGLRSAPVYEQERAVYRWLRESTPPDTLLMTLYARTAELLSERRCLQSPPVTQWCDYLDHAVRNQVDYILVGKGTGSAKRDLFGRSSVPQPFRVDLWAGASALTTRVYDDPLMAVFAVKVERERWRDAYGLYRQVGSLDWEDQRPQVEQALRDALRVVGDFPEARSLLALLLAEKGRAEEAQALLEWVAVRYPFDFGNRYNLALLRFRGGDSEHAAGDLRQALGLARSLGAPGADVARLGQLLGEIERAR